MLSVGYKEKRYAIFIAATMLSNNSFASNDIFKITLSDNNRTYYFSGLKPYENTGNNNIYIQYYIKGYTDPSDPQQYKRIPIENTNYAKITKMNNDNSPNVFIQTNNGENIEGIHGYALCISETNSPMNSSGCKPTTLTSDSTSYINQKIEPSSITELTKINNEQERVIAIKEIKEAPTRYAQQIELQQQAREQEAQQRLKEIAQKEQREKEQIEIFKKTTKELRKSIKTGDQTNCGLVIEVKSPIVQIQTMIGENWIRIDQIYPSNVECRFVNGVYQPPRLFN